MNLKATRETVNKEQSARLLSDGAQKRETNMPHWHVQRAYESATSA
jgi:hypothetical protein